MDSEEDKQQESVWTRCGRTIRQLPGAALMFVVVPLVTLGYFGWYYYGAEHLDRALYSLRVENLVVTPKPEWIKSDIVAEVFNSHNLASVSLLDPHANASIAQAFEQHNWVKTSARVTKSSGGRVRVDLIYRSPLAFIWTPSTPHGEGFYPVDEEGYILPTKDFSESDVENSFVIAIEDLQLPPRTGDVAMPFRDPRVNEALLLCRYLQPHRAQLQIQQVVVGEDPRSAGPSPFVMKLVTRDNLDLIWGHAPDRESVGEPPAESKLARLADWLPLARNSARRETLDLRLAEHQPGYGGLDVNPASH